MKQVIALFSFVFVSGIISVNAQCCGKTAQAANETRSLAQETNESTVEAYYFHTTRRCVSCRNVERVSSEILQDLYGDKIPLETVNIDDKKNEELIKKLGVEGMSFLIVNGNKKEDLLFDGFRYAMREPEKFKEKIKTTVESMK